MSALHFPHFISSLPSVPRRRRRGSSSSICRHWRRKVLRTRARDLEEHKRRRGGMISQFFVLFLSQRGDHIVFHDYRGKVPKGSAEIFFRKVKFWNDEEAEEHPQSSYISEHMLTILDIIINVVGER